MNDTSATTDAPRVRVERTVVDQVTVLSVPIPGEAAAVYVRASLGAADELPGEHGLAHFFEHMIFKGTDTRGLGGSAHVIERLGGDLNAWTSHDELVVHATVAGGAWSDTLEVIVDMLRRATLDPDEVVRERLVVQEEIASYADDADDGLSEAVQASLWGDHPYGRPVIGTHDSVGALTAAQVTAFRARELGRDRLTVVVVADTDHAAVEARVAALVQGWATVGPRRPLPVARGSAGVARPSGTFDDRVVELAWPAPPTDHPDTPALAVLASILGSTCGDRITEALDEDPKLGFDGWADVWTGLSAGTFQLGFRPLPGRTATALTRIGTLLDGFRRTVRGRLVLRARETMLADLDFAEQTVDGIGETVLHHEALTGDPAAHLHWRARLAAVRAEDVSRAARRWLDPAAAVVGVHEPALTDDEARAAWLSRPSRPVRSAADDGVVKVVVAGTPVIIAPTPVPVASVRVLAHGGALDAPDHLPGLGAAWAGTVHRGAGPYDGEALHDALDDLAADLAPIDGTQAWALTATTIGPHLLDLVELLGEIVLDAHLAEDEWSLVREELLDAVRTRLDRPREVVTERALALRFPGHPWRHPPAGTETSLNKLDARALSKAHDGHFSRGRCAVVIAGPVDPDEVLDALTWLDELPAGVKPKKAPAWPALKPGVHTVEAGTHQSIVSVWGTGVGLEQVDRRGLELAEALLDGQSGRLFLELRERRGLAYELWATSEERLGGGIFQAGLLCDPSRVDEASEALRAVIATLVTHPPDDEELARARALLIGRDTLRTQRIEARASRLGFTALYGIDVSPEAYRARLLATTRDQLVAEVEQVLAAGFLEVRSTPRIR